MMYAASKSTPSFCLQHMTRTGPLWFTGSTGEKAAKAMHAIADAVTQCKFEATNPAADEVVLYKILQVSFPPYASPHMYVCVS